MPGAKNYWWRRIANRVSMWLTPINIVAFGITSIGTIVEFFLIRNKANNPEWYRISKEHAEEIKPCLSEYMPKASWGEALSTFFLDDWWSWEIVGWACAVGLPILVMVTAFEKHKTYQRIRDMLYRKEEERTIIKLDSYAENTLISRLIEIYSPAEYQLSELKEIITPLLNSTGKIDDSTRSCIINLFRQTSNLIDQGKQQIPAVIDEIVEQRQDEENNTLTPDDIQKTISAKTVWSNSYKNILLIITPKMGLNFSFLFTALYEFSVGNHYAKKFRHIVPDILNQLEHDPNYNHIDHACLKVMSCAIATDKIYNINAKLVSLLVPSIIILGVGAYAVLPKFIKWIRGSNDEEERMRLLEGSEPIYGTNEYDQKPGCVELTNILPQEQVLI